MNLKISFFLSCPKTLFQSLKKRKMQILGNFFPYIFIAHNMKFVILSAESLHSKVYFLCI